MKKKPLRTAAEVMAELNADPDFLRRKAEKDKRRQARKEYLDSLEGPILDKLRSLGFEATSIHHAVQRYAPLPDSIVAVFLDSLQQASDPSILEALIRALAAAAHPFDGRPLVKHYESYNRDHMRYHLCWVIANTIACAKPHSIQAWTDEALRDPDLGRTLRDLGF